MNLAKATGNQLVKIFYIPMFVAVMILGPSILNSLITCFTQLAEEHVLAHEML